jgi:hypothetical protein
MIWHKILIFSGYFMQNFTSNDCTSAKAELVLERWKDPLFQTVEQPLDAVLNYRIKIASVAINAK